MYLVYMVDTSDEMSTMSGDCQTPMATSGLTPCCMVSAEDAMKHSAKPGKCSCDVAVAPNRTYAFAVEASNGVRTSGLGKAALPVCVPARVPPPPPHAPEVCLQPDGAGATLKWAMPLRGGGLLLNSFRIGVLGPEAMGCDVEQMSSAMEKQVVVSVDVVTSNAGAAVAVASLEESISDSPCPCIAYVDGLQADRQYRFSLAAANAVGTGRWSAVSATVSTPVAAPAAPVNMVATVGMDANQNVMVTINWECGLGCPGSGAMAAFHVLLCPLAGEKAKGGLTPNYTAEVKQRLVANAAAPGTSRTWTAPLTMPGAYHVEVAAENTAGKRSEPAALSFEVPPTAFPAAEPELELVAPCWAEEPLLVLGPAEGTSLSWDVANEAAVCLQTLLLWNSSDEASGSGPSQASQAKVAKGRQVQSCSSSGLAVSSTCTGVDVTCFYRSPSTGQSTMRVLAAGVTSSRLQVVLPTRIAMSLRLTTKHETSGASSRPKASSSEAELLQSEPLLLLMSEDSGYLRPVWEVWTRQSADGQPPKWIPLPDNLQANIEAAWLEGLKRINFDLPYQPSMLGEASHPLSAGTYSLTFGDERLVQHSVTRLVPSGWTANARRVVQQADGIEEVPPEVPAEDQCVICMERRRTHAFMHAETGDGHLAVCGSCAEAFRVETSVRGGAQAVRTCPMCRRNFSSVQRIFQ